MRLDVKERAIHVHHNPEERHREDYLRKEFIDSSYSGYKKAIDNPDSFVWAGYEFGKVGFVDRTPVGK